MSLYTTDKQTVTLLGYMKETELVHKLKKHSNFNNSKNNTT